MGMQFFSRIGSSSLSSVHFSHLGIRNCFLFKRTDFSSLFHGAASASALALEDPVVDCVPVCKTSVNCAQSNSEINSLFPVVVRVFHTLCWKVATEIRFYRAVQEYGLHHSVDVFRVFVHIFASARMEREVYSLLWDMVCFYREANLDMFHLFNTMLDSSEYVGRSVFVFETLTKVLAANSMLENALDVFFRAKKIGAQLGIKPCNFLLKCLAESNKGGYAESLFAEMKLFGPLPSVFTYTCLLYTSPSPRDGLLSRMPSSA